MLMTCPSKQIISSGKDPQLNTSSQELQHLEKHENG